MRDITGAPSSSTMLRWITLMTVVANAEFIDIYNGHSETPTIAEVAAEFGDSFLPAGFAQGVLRGDARRVPVLLRGCPMAT